MGWFDPLFDRLLDCTDPKFLDRLLLKEQSDPDQGLHVWQFRLQLLDGLLYG